MSDPQSEMRSRAAALVEQGSAALKGGDIAQAYTSLREAVKLDPENERAWLWLAGTVATDDQRRFCLQRVLQINPQNQAAKRGLAALPPASAAPAPQPARPAAPFDPLAQPASAAPAPQPARPAAPFDPLAQQRPASAPPPMELPRPAASPPPMELPRPIPPPAPLPSMELPRGQSAASDDDEQAPSLERLQREQEKYAPPTTRPSFVKQVKVGEAKAAEPAAARPNIPIEGARKRPDRGLLTLLGLGGVLIVVVGLIIFLILGELAQREQQAALPTAAVTQPTAEGGDPAPTAEPAEAIDVARLVADADSAAGAEDHERAVELYTQALAAGDDAGTLFKRGTSLFALGRYPEAEADFSAVIAIGPTAEAYHQRGRARTRSGNGAGAIEDFTSAIALNPNDAVSFLRRGIARRGLGDLESARADFDQALTIKPDYVDALVNRAELRRADGDLEGARADYDTILQAQADVPIALIGRGSVEVDLGDFRAGIADCARATEVAPDVVEAFYCLGRAHAGAEEYQEALAHLSKALELNPDYPDAYRERGRAQLALGNADEARSDLEKALQIYRDFGDQASADATQAEIDKIP